MPVRPFAAAALSLALSAASAAAQPPPPAAPRAEVPIREVVLSDGARRYTIPIKVGGVSIEAGLDTGSTGLRILPGVLGAEDAVPSHRDESYAYGSGSRYEGVAGEAQLGVGGLAGRAPVQLIQKLGCVPRFPHCPASRIPADQYGVQGDGLPNEGFKAILGSNMAQARIGNPFTALGARRWIVELPRPGEGQPGRLILNPTDAELAGYVTVPLAAVNARQEGGGLHDSAPGCLVNARTQARACGAVLLDSGAPGIRVLNVGLGHEPWPNGDPALIVFLDAGGHPLAAERLTIGQRAHASHLSFEAEPRAPGVVIFAGLSPYFAFSVLYDFHPSSDRAEGPAAGAGRTAGRRGRRRVLRMARETSAGVLAYRRGAGGPEFLLVHPGGPYWAKKDEAGWSIPKGVVDEGEESWAAARREFAEELGQPIEGAAQPLTPCPTPGGKLILAWLVEADLDLSEVRSNRFEIEWPPRSGRRASFPEIDRAGYFDAATAAWKLHKGQRPILAEAVSRLRT